MLRPKTSDASSAVSSSASFSFRQRAEGLKDSSSANQFNYGHSDSTPPSLNRRVHSASSRLITALSSSPQYAAPSDACAESVFSTNSSNSPLTSFSRPQSSMSSRSIKLRPQTGTAHIDAAAILQSSLYHGVPISKRSVPSDSFTPALQPIMLPQSGRSRDVYVRSGDSVVMFDEEAVRFASFVNSAEVLFAQLPPPSRSTMKDRVAAACSILEKLCVFESPAQRIMKLIKADIYRGIWQNYESAAPNTPEAFENKRGYFEDTLGIASALQSLAEESNEAQAQAATLRDSCALKDQRIAELEAIVSSLKEENVMFKEKEGSFQEIFARSLVRMRSDQAKRIEVEKDLRDMQLKVAIDFQIIKEDFVMCFSDIYQKIIEAAFIHMAENEREDSRQRMNAIELAMKQMEQAYVDGERKRQELQHAMDSMFSRSAYTCLYRNHEKKKVLLSRLEAEVRFKVMTQVPESAKESANPAALSDDKGDKFKKAASASKRNPATGSKQSKAPEDTLEGAKHFNSLGEGRDVPRYLRSIAPVQHQVLSLQETRKLVQDFWHQVESSYASSAGAGIHEYLNSFFGKRADFPDVVSLACSLIAAARTYSQNDVWIEIFWKTWSGEYSEDVFIHQFRIIRDFEDFIRLKLSCTNGFISMENLESALSTYFPQKQIADICDLMDRVQSSGACAGKTVELSRLLDNRNGVDSPFLLLLWQQGLGERALLSQLLQEAVLKIEPMAALKVKCRHIRSAFLLIDPNRPKDILEANLQLGFGMPHGCDVLSEDVVTFDDFMLLFSTGPMRLYSSSAFRSIKHETISEK